MKVQKKVTNSRSLSSSLQTNDQTNNNNNYNNNNDKNNNNCDMPASIFAEHRDPCGEENT